MYAIQFFFKENMTMGLDLTAESQEEAIKMLEKYIQSIDRALKAGRICQIDETNVIIPQNILFLRLVKKDEPKVAEPIEENA